MGDLSDHFSSREFQCRCGCALTAIDPRLIQALESMRDITEGPINITSGVRCAEHNKRIGGSEDSSHLPDPATGYGRAADIRVDGSIERHGFVMAALIAFDRVGVHKDFIHVDVDDEKARPVLWLYRCGNNRNNLLDKAERDSK